MNTNKFKVGIIGMGFIGKIHLEELSRVEGIEVLAIADSNIELVKNIGERFGIKKIYSDWEELVNDKDIEVVHNCTPNNLHFEVNQKVIESGKEIFSEKPLALSSEESGILVEKAREKGTITGINFCYRYYPVIQEAAYRIKSGEIGNVHTVLGHYLQDWLLYSTDYSWRLDPKFSGRSNVMGDLGSHWCDLVQFITGSRIKEVMAELRTVIPKRQRPKDKSALTFSDRISQNSEEVDITLDDYGALMLRFENNARGTFTTAQVCAGRKCNIDIQVYGTEKSLAWNHERPSELWMGKRNEANEIFFESPLLQHKSTQHYATLPSGHPMGYRDAVLNLFRDYYNTIKDKREGNKAISNHPDFIAGHNEMLVLEAALESVEQRTWTEVKYNDF
ncbi:MAG: Gfo/Idh/MocA family oxidoreductase [bacterium]|nr:Gfo/Idh/MocA family oxidoreductase [bacterium]